MEVDSLAEAEAAEAAEVASETFSELQAIL